MSLEFTPALCILDIHAASDEEALNAMATRAVSSGHARSSFPAALLARERDYPTGLPTATPIAIPHADPEHVLEPALGFGLLEHPVPFGEMGDPANTVAVSAIVLLLVSTDEVRVDTLQAVIALFQSTGWRGAVEAAADPDSVARVLNAMLNASR